MISAKKDDSQIRKRERKEDGGSYHGAQCRGSWVFTVRSSGMEREKGDTEVDELIHQRRNKSGDKDAGLEKLKKSLRRNFKGSSEEKIQIFWSEL